MKIFITEDSFTEMEEIEEREGRGEDDLLFTEDLMSKFRCEFDIIIF